MCGDFAPDVEKVLCDYTSVLNGLNGATLIHNKTPTGTVFRHLQINGRAESAGDCLQRDPRLRFGEDSGREQQADCDGDKFGSSSDPRDAMTHAFPSDTD